MKRKTKAQTPEAILEAGEVEARRVLERAEDRAEAAAQALDAAELKERVTARKAEVIEAAARAAQGAIEARGQADRFTAAAARHAAQASELEREIRTREALFRERRDAVESLTADGRAEAALELERSLADFDATKLREELAAVRAAERDARARVVSARALADQLSAEAGSERAALEAVETEFEPEFERRRVARATRRSSRVFAYDQRMLTLATASEAVLKELEEEERTMRAVDSANAIWPDGAVIEVDRDRRVRGVHLPITTKS